MPPIHSEPIPLADGPMPSSAALTALTGGVGGSGGPPGAVHGGPPGDMVMMGSGDPELLDTDLIGLLEAALDAEGVSGTPPGGSHTLGAVAPPDVHQPISYPPTVTVPAVPDTSSSSMSDRSGESVPDISHPSWSSPGVVVPSGGRSGSHAVPPLPLPTSALFFIHYRAISFQALPNRKFLQVL